MLIWLYKTPPFLLDIIPYLTFSIDLTYFSKKLCPGLFEQPNKFLKIDRYFCWQKLHCPFFTFKACDLAVRENHHEIALFLESRMVFDSTPDDLRSSEITLNSTSGSLGRSSFEVTEAIETSEVCSTNGGLLRSQVRL